VAAADGLAIALRAARDGANVAIGGQDRRAAPELKGHLPAADEVRAAAGKALPVLCIPGTRRSDRGHRQDRGRVRGIDICVNNASAIA